MSISPNTDEMLRKKGMKVKLEDHTGMPGWFLLVLAIISGLAVANIYYCQPLLEVIRRDLGVSAVQVSQLTVMAQIGYALGLFFIIPMADLFNRRRLLVICLSVLILSLLLLGSASTLTIAAIASLGIGICSMIPQFFIPIASQYSTPNTKSRNVGYVLSGLLTGILLSRAISGYIGKLMGWRMIFYIAAILMVASLVVLLIVLPRTRTNFSGSYGSLMKSIFHLIAEHSGVRICALRAAFAFGSLLAMWSCLAFHLAGAPFHADSDIVGLLGLCGVFGVMVVSNIGGLIHKYGVRPFNYIGSFAHIISWMIFFIWGDSYTGLIMGIILIDMGHQCIQLSNQSYCMSVDTLAANRLNTIFMTTYFIGGSLGTFFAGIGWEIAHWHGVITVGLIFAVLSLVMTFISKSLGLKV